jgi:FlaA1/EpsC-like NDP-sugar epimerase
MDMNAVARGGPPPTLQERADRQPGQWPFRLRGRYLLALDMVGVVVAAYLAVVLRFERLDAPALVAGFPLAVAVVVSTRTGVNSLCGLYTRRWRHASIPELETILAAMATATLAAAAIYYGVCAVANPTWADAFPRSFWPVELLLSSVAIGGVRFGIRAVADATPRGGRAGARADRATLIYGAGETGTLLARSARRNPGSGVLPVGFLDDDPGIQGGIVAGLRVYGGLESMSIAVAATGATNLLIAMPSAAGSAVRRVVDAALAINLEVRTVPSLTDLLDGTVDAYRVRPVRVEDLLRRPMIADSLSGAEEIIRDRTVVITGGAGSIGSELARQVFALGPKRLVLVDRAESPLYMVQRELEMRRERGHTQAVVEIHLANVASRAAMFHLIDSVRPSVIFHAAAYKHVPMMESHPSEAAYVNIRGTTVLLDAAAAAGVERFVFVSTDKAVNPCSVMGASKRIAEMLVADTARRTGRPYVSVRFGNVLGSNGSVIPIFQQQLEAGGPLTITHPDMTRYFMTIPEACRLILEAAALGRDGDVFVLDMGEPVRILDLARDLIRLAGRDPDSQAIQTIGLRPGERLHEALFYDTEHVEPTASAKVLRAIAPPPPTDVRAHVERILAFATGEREQELGAAMLDYARRAEEVDTTTAPAPGLDADDGQAATTAAGPGRPLDDLAVVPTPRPTRAAKAAQEIVARALAASRPDWDGR